MVDDRKPVDPAVHRPEVEPAPGFDPVHPANDPAVERDRAAVPPRGTNTTVVSSGSGRSGLMIAGIIAVVAIIALIVAMNWDRGGPQTTTVPAEPTAVEQTAPAAQDETAAPAADEPAATEDETAPATDEPEPVE